jgi:acyl dehydratase
VIALEPRSVAFSLDTLRAYGGAGDNVHSSEKAAQSLGLPGVICWGTLTLSPFFEMISDLAGAQWLIGGSLTARLRRPVFASEPVLYTGSEVSSNDDYRAFELLASTDRSGVVATARAMLSKAASPAVPSPLNCCIATESIKTSGVRSRRVLDRLRDLDRTAHVIGRPVPILKRVRRSILTWETAIPGLEFPPLEYEVDHSVVEVYRRLHARWSNTAVSSDTVLPLLFADEPMQCVNTLFARSGRLHIEHEITAMRPIPMGATVISRARIANREEKGERRYARIDCTVAVAEANDEDPAVRISATIMF